MFGNKRWNHSDSVRKNIWNRIQKIFEKANQQKYMQNNQRNQSFIDIANLTEKLVIPYAHRIS